MMKWKTPVAVVFACLAGIVTGNGLYPPTITKVDNLLDRGVNKRDGDSNPQTRKIRLNEDGSENTAETYFPEERSVSTGIAAYRSILIQMKALSALAQKDPESALLALMEIRNLPPAGKRFIVAAVLTVVVDHNPEVALQWMTKNSGLLTNPNPFSIEGNGLERDLWRKMVSVIAVDRTDSDTGWLGEIINSRSQIGSEVAVEVISKRDMKLAVELINQNLGQTWIIEDMENGFVNGFLSSSSISATDEVINLHEWISETFTGRQKRNAENKLLKNLVTSGEIESAREIVNRFSAGPHRRSWEEIISGLSRRG